MDLQLPILAILVQDKNVQIETHNSRFLAERERDTELQPRWLEFGYHTNCEEGEKEQKARELGRFHSTFERNYE